ncbi:MAG TPA: trigger factor [Dehalococcoidia bacterium]|nr:trigger factor [Dehalococcoidia bacterium]
MKSTLDKTENHMSYLTVVNEISEMEGYMEKAYQRLVKRTEVPGFRKGNAPRDILEKHVGREKLLEDAIREAVPFICDDVIKEHNLEPVMQPMVKIVENEPLKFEMIVALKPTVELGDYKSMVVEPEPLEVSDEELNEVLDNLRKQYGGSSESSDSPIKYGDNVTADIIGEIYETPIIRNEGITFELNSEFAKEIPGLADKLVGMKKGEESKFKLTLPDDYENKVVAGKEIEFTATIKDVRGMTLPELDDEFAKKVSPGIESLEALKDRIRTNLKSEKERNAVANYEEKVIEKLIEISKLEYPPVMIDMELQDLIQEYKRQLQASCRDEKEFEERMKRVPEAKLRENGKPMAKKRVLWTLVVSEVAKQEGVTVSDQEVDDEIENMLKDAGQGKEEMRKYLQESNGRREVGSFLQAKKTIKQLVEMVKANTPSEN